MDRPKWHLKVVHMAVTIALVLSLMSIAFLPPVLAQGPNVSINVQISSRLLCCSENTTVTANITNTGDQDLTNVVPSIVGMVRLSKLKGPDKTGFGLTIGQSKNVIWVLHCTNPGAASFFVQVDATEGGPWQQAGPPITQDAPALELTITDWPADKKVCVCEEFDIVFNITNTGNCTAYMVGVSWDILPPRTAELLDVVGLPADIPPGKNATVTATFHCTDYGDSLIHFDPFGFPCPGGEGKEIEGVSDAITITQQKVHLVVNLTAPEAVCYNETFNVTVNITNIGNIEALDVVPSVSMDPPGGADCTKLNPPMRGSIPAGESRNFNLTCNCSAPGPVEFSVDNVTGIMTEKCAGDPIPQDNIELPPPVTVMQEKAHLVVTLDVPEEICLSDNFTVTVTVNNTGTAGALNVTPTMTLGRDGGDADCGNFSPASANISVNGTAIFTSNCTCNATGAMNITVNVTGFDNCTGNRIPAKNIEQADTVNVTQEKVHLDVDLSLNTTEICVCHNFTVTVNITNTGNVEALNVTPSIGKSPDSGANCSGPYPAAANISPDGTANFTWNCHCEAAGNVTVNVTNVTGQMGGACNGTDIPEDNITLPPAVNITQYKAHLNVTHDVLPTEVCPCHNFSYRVWVTNTGNTPALNVVPTAIWTPFELAEICSGPIPHVANITPGETVLFVWCMHCLGGGTVNMTVNITATDGCTLEPMPQDNIDIPEEDAIIEQKEAVLIVKLDAPDKVCVSTIFNVTANITNNGTAGASNVVPVLMLNPEYAELLSGPNPPSADIARNATANFTWTYHCNATGTMNITINVTGIDMCDGVSQIGADDIYLPPPEVVIQQKVHIDVLEFYADRDEVCVCNNFTVRVHLFNWGNVVAQNVAPKLFINPPSGASVSGPHPPSANITPYSCAFFNFTLHCDEEGELEIALNVTGQMGGACNGTDIPADNIWLPGTINITQYPPMDVWCDAEPDVQHVCHAVNFTANATGGSGNYSFTWNFGDPICDPINNVAYTQNASHTYMCTGTYTATVTVSDGICDNVTCSVNVTIILEPPELISPPNGSMVITNGSGNVCFNWTDIGCCNYTLQIWQKEEWGQKIWNIQTGKNSTWCVPLMPDYYRWQVVATDKCGEWVVSETWYFGVDMDIEYPYVEVTRPVGGETWVGGTNETITWFASEFTEFPVFGDDPGLNQEDLVITIFYSIDGGDNWTPIPMDGVNDGACLWMVPMIDSSQCVIKVVATDAQGNPGNDVSGLFTIVTDATPPTVTVSWPNGGESLQGGDTEDIQWTATDDVGVTSVDLFLWDGDTWSPIAIGQANDGSHTWMVPHINSDQCLVKVAAHDAAGNVGSDTSDEVFTIASDEIYPDVTVNFPNGGEVFTGGTDVVVTWEATEFQSPSGGMEGSQSDLTIELYYSTDGGANWIAIPMDGVNDGVHLWTVPMVNSVLCLIRVDATDDFNNTGTDTSNGVFTIVGEPSCPASFNISLEAGWNLISLPLIPDNPKIGVVISNITGPGAIMQVWAWNAQSQRYLAYIPMVGGNLTMMVDGLGYWVSANGTATLTIYGVCMPEPPQAPPVYDVYEGWDLIGIKSVTTRTTDDYLRTIDEQYDVLWGYGSDYILVHPSPPGTGLMNPGDGFWIYMTSDGTIIPPGN